MHLAEIGSEVVMETCQQAPDGGWGWLIVLAAFVQVSLVFGVVRSVGVFFIEFTEYFQESSTAISWITSIALCVHQFASPIASTLSNQFGSRSVVIVGGISACIGFLCASFAHCLLHLYLSLGLLTVLQESLHWLETFSMACLRSILGLTRLDCVRGSQIV
ncbi:monocarboxylate transporter 13-like isoform X5 [Lethenteron reissneri]|uniref:monocarboxylate transporter 13-like isoform X5 n=1 Tax=Lethenteron reissneri TaxID=7753 RepID=UPI002AB6234B|nr:monocarboxylate transporter 13-like isoform X5 [Lethenteron reissneri]